jgi:hypothetical protein
MRKGERNSNSSSRWNLRNEKESFKREGLKTGRLEILVDKRQIVLL